MEAVVAAVVLAAYATLLFELTVIHVPSVASSLSLWAPRREWLEMYSPGYRRLFELSRAAKLLVFGPPLLIVYAVFCYPLVAVFLGPDLLGDDLFVPGAVLQSIAIGLIVLGRAFALVSARAIRRDNRQMASSFELHTSGPFRWSRNPGLVGMYVFVAGLWLVNPSAALLAAIVVYVLYMDFKVRMEENFLDNKYRERYTDYRLRTGRYLP